MEEDLDDHLTVNCGDDWAMCTATEAKSMRTECDVASDIFDEDFDEVTDDKAEMFAAEELSAASQVKYLIWILMRPQMTQLNVKTCLDSQIIQQKQIVTSEVCVMFYLIKGDQLLECLCKANKMFLFVLFGNSLG